MSQNRKNWTDFEDRAVTILVKRYGTKNWAEISEKMSSKYGIDTRSGKQCRERWHNHLDPQINKQSWSNKEQKLMFEAHQQYGNKWTEIAKLFDGRTDNDIKNHFYSMLRRSLRRINKMLGRRNSTQRIKVIKPSVLSKIFVNIGVKDDKKSQQCKKISQALYQFSKTKPDSDHSETLQLQQKKRLEDLIERLSHYNDEYQMSQLLKKQSKKSLNSQNSQNDVQPVSIPTLKNVTSDASVHSPKSKKIRRIVRRKNSRKEQVKQQEQQVSKRTRKSSGNNKFDKAQSEVKIQDNVKLEANETSYKDKDGQHFYMTRLRKNESGLSLGEEFFLPDLGQEICRLPSQEGSMRLRNSSSLFSHSPGFGFNNPTNASLFSGPSPQAQFKGWTPLCPSPNLNDFICRPGVNYELKTNNDDLDNVVNQLRRKIEQQSSRME